jgi:hypothetical protein
MVGLAKPQWHAEYDFFADVTDYIVDALLDILVVVGGCSTHLIILQVTFP